MYWNSKVCNELRTKIKEHDIPLHELDLVGADLSHLDLHGQSFNDCNLTQTNLAGADLSYADFRGATIYKTSFTNADMHGAIHGTGTSWRECAFNQVNMRHCQISEIDFTYSYFGGASMDNVLANDSNFTKCWFNQATLYNADLSYSDMTATILQDTDLEYANLRGVILDDAVVTNANLNGTHHSYQFVITKALSAIRVNDMHERLFNV